MSVYDPVRIAHQPTRTKVVLDPRLPSNVLFLKKFRPEEVMPAFEAGQVVVFDDLREFRPDVDLNFLNLQPVWPDLGTDRAIKKAKLPALLAPLEKTTFANHVLGKMFPGDWKTALRYRNEASKATEFMRTMFRRLFPTYQFTGEEGHSWRLVETFPESLHVDSYNEGGAALTHVRLFYNFDTMPRIWNTTHDAPTLLRQFASLVPKERLGASGNELNAILNNQVPWHTLPRHQVFFAPGALWICDSRLVSHEVVYGRRCWAYTFSCKPEGLQKPEIRFQERMRQVAEELAR